MGDINSGDTENHKIFRNKNRGKSDGGSNLPHHEDKEAFQRNFATDVKKICNGMEINPFEESNFVNISNTSVFYDEEIKTSLKVILREGEAQFQMFLKERLIDRTKSVDAPIKKNNYKLPRTANDAMKEKEKKLIYSPAIMNKLRECLRVFPLS